MLKIILRRYVFYLLVAVLLLPLVRTGCAPSICARTDGQSVAGTVLNSPAPAATREVSNSTLPDFAPVIAAVRPAVVAITTQVTGYTFFGRPYSQEGAGSGWIVDSRGLIVTNYHVIEDASSITVTLENGESYPASVVKADAVNDLAVIKIDAQGLTALKMGDSSSLKVGNWVIALGNSLGMGISATKGIVSALGVSLTVSAGDTMQNLIQTDAAINPGNSGGPLINLNGEVVGINSAKVSQVGVEGMGYAISINEARDFIQSALK
jgi:S1-C subfamily serine protease